MKGKRGGGEDGLADILITIVADTAPAAANLCRYKQQQQPGLRIRIRIVKKIGS